MKKSSLFRLLVILILGTTLSACNLQLKTTESPDGNQPTPTLTQLAPSDAQPTTIEVTAWEDGQTALALLESVATVQKKEYGFGVFVDGINGLLGNQDNYWAFYVNNEYAQRGADQTTLNTGDVVKFVYEPVTASPIDEENNSQSSQTNDPNLSGEES